MGRKAVRKFYKYTLQMHEPDGRYDDIFSTLRGMTRRQRLVERGDGRYLIQDVLRRPKGYVVRLLEIKEDTDFTTFDEEDFSVSEDALPDNKRFATASHGLFLSHTRSFYFEYVRGGAKIEDATSAMQALLRQASPEFRRVRLVATPVIDEAFLNDVAKLDRVRLVRIDVSEPNASWADWDDPLHQLGDESGAESVSIQATAPRAESLKKRGGILQVLREGLRAPNSHVKRAVVEGRMPDETVPRTLRTDKEHDFIAKSVNVDSGGSTNIASATAILDTLPNDQDLQA